jgi:endonuclease/exonuclease/phosphatase family metal-dependent hydrolase
VKYAGKRFRFLNTHLESFVDATRVKQAKELVAKGGPARSTGPVVLVGDLNSDPKGRGNNGAGAYKAVTAFGFADGWSQLHLGNGVTCCSNKELTGPRFSGVDNGRIDYLMTKGGGYRFVKASHTGTRSRTPSGLWDSDHVGTVGTVRLGKK